jgi:hypothetical protein
VVNTPAGRAATVLAFPGHAPRLQGVSERFTSPPLVWGGGRRSRLGGEDRAWREKIAPGGEDRAWKGEDRAWGEKIAPGGRRSRLEGEDCAWGEKIAPGWRRSRLEGRRSRLGVEDRACGEKIAPGGRRSRLGGEDRASTLIFLKIFVIDIGAQIKSNFFTSSK